MNKRIIIPIILIICVIVGIIFVVYNMVTYGNNTNKLNKKVSKLQSTLLNDEAINFGKDKFVVFLSVTDTNQKAYVTNAVGKTLKEAIANSEEKMEAKVKEYKVNPEWVRIDVVNEMREVSQEEFKEELDVRENFYRRGVALDENYDIALLETELNANAIIDYESKTINQENLNQYINSNYKYNKKVDSLPNDIITFTCISYIYDSENVHRLNSEENYGRRNVENMDELQLVEIMDNTSKYLMDSINEQGRFVYSYFPGTNVEDPSYNIIRHEGAVWILTDIYKLTQNQELKSKIKLAVEYIEKNYIKYKDENTAYIIEEGTNEIKLGASGVGILMFVEYMETFKTDEYKDLVIKLGNGIVETQEEDGSYYHVYRYPEFSRAEKFRAVYYDGEATYALAKLYGYTKDEKWLNTAEKALDYFYKNKYEQHKDHWIEHAVNEVTKYSPKREYLELGLKNVRDNLESMIKEEEYCFPTDLELLTASIEIYDRALENNVYLDGFNIKDVINVIYYIANLQLDGLFYPETAMYFHNPIRILNAIYIRESKFEINIGDIQHNMNGYYNMYQNYKLLEKYSK